MRIRFSFKKKPSSILDACISDIENGLWICGSICDVNRDQKVVGCALGLVGINAGLAYLDGDQVVVPYPSEAVNNGKPWSAGALKAVDLLSDAIPAGEYHNDDTAEDRVYHYNDQYNSVGNLTAEEAIAWFRRARAMA